jgi:diguanylate cyclase (GGDEF)-like protein/PAS domain S-box-containing protein
MDPAKPEATPGSLAANELSDMGIRSRAFRELLLLLPVVTFVIDADFKLDGIGGSGIPVNNSTDAEDVRSKLIGRDVLSIVEAKPGGDLEATLRSAFSGLRERATFRIYHRWYDTYLEPLRGRDGRVIGVAGIALNISSERDALRALEISDGNLKRASRLARLMWWNYDIERKRISISDDMRELYGFAPKDRIDRERVVAMIHPDDRARIRKTLVEAERDGIPCRGTDYRLLQPDGGFIWVLQQIEVETDATGKPIELSGTVLDITERKEFEEHLRRLAHVDGLTGLANRTWLGERLAETLRAPDERDSTALLFIDVDGFKSINDTYGHASGDELLKQIARRIKGCLRADDFVARSGGDEFVVLLVPSGDVASVSSLCTRIVEMSSMPYDIENRELFVSVSIGVSLAPADATSGRALWRNADSALYAAKIAGRNTFRFFTSSMHRAAVRQLALQNDLRRAVERDEIFIVYQPIVSAAGDVVAVEALARWRHPEFGLIDPSAFIPIAEQTGTIREIGAYVTSEACRALKSWRDIAPNLRLALNISAQQLVRDDLAAMLDEALGRSGLAMTALDLEVTETLLMRDVSRAAALLAEFRKRGARISIDDFGTGYSSLAWLRDLPIDTIKIDRSFIENIEREAASLVIVGSIVSLGEALDLDVVAEGVERESQVETLRGVGCRLFQGYAFSRPLRVERIAGVLRDIPHARRVPALATSPTFAE